MDKLKLALRQRKLLHRMQHQETFITGNELAKELGVSPRTIRNDVVEINRNIRPYHARIRSERSKGYCFEAEDPERIRRLNQIELALLTKADRIRYLILRLCLAEEPLHFLDLEDEIFVSHTTLSQDLQSLKQKYVAPEPFLKLIQKKNELYLEKDEKKTRELLVRLFHEDWNYNKKGSAYYGYNFLNEHILDFVMEQIPVLLHKHRIRMEEPTLIYLDLTVAIMCQRVHSGHTLSELPVKPREDQEAWRACLDLFDLLERQYECTFPEAEKDFIYERIASGRMLDVFRINPQTLPEHIDPRTRQIAGRYLEKIRSVFGIDFFDDDDFYITLCLSIRDLRNESYIYNEQENPVLAKENLLTEYEIAILFQSLAEEYLGHGLSEIQLIHLAHCISGGLEFLFCTHPEYKLRTVLCSHRNMVTAWSAKRKILGAFNNYLDITALISVSEALNFDFSQTDLVLTTVKTKQTQGLTAVTLPISHVFTEADRNRISAFIDVKRIERLCPSPASTPRELLRNAFWHERTSLKTREDIVEVLAGDLADDNLPADRLLADLQERETVTSFVTGPSIVFLHSLIPAERTKLSAMTLDHRIIWNNYKIRLIILGVFRPEELPLLFQLKHLFHHLDRDSMRFLKMKEEICAFFFPNDL